MFVGVDDEGYASCCAVIEHMDLTAGPATRSRAPTLVIAGAQDPATPPAEHAERIADGIPGARLEVLDPGAHLINVERPDAVTAADPRAPGAHDGRPRYEAGMKVRREVLGDEHVDRATANATDFSRPFQEYITRSAWGEAWTRAGPGPQDALAASRSRS